MLKYSILLLKSAANYCIKGDHFLGFIKLIINICMIYWHSNETRRYMIPGINEALETSSVGMSLEGLADGLKFLAEVQCNLW